MAANDPSRFPLKLRELTLLPPFVFLAQRLVVHTQNQALEGFTDSTSWRHWVGGGEKLFTAFDPEIPGQRIYSNEITG